MSPVSSMFVCIIKKKNKKLSANLFLKWPISIIGKMLNIGADNRSTPSSVISILVRDLGYNIFIKYLASTLLKTQFKCA